MQVTQTPSINSNAINPNFIFCNSNYSPSINFKNLGSSATVFPSLKPISRIPKANNFHSTRRRRFHPFVVAAAAKTASSGADYYSVLKVSRNATLQEIKAAYRSLARKVYIYIYMNIYINAPVEFCWVLFPIDSIRKKSFIWAKVACNSSLYNHYIWIW